MKGNRQILEQNLTALIIKYGLREDIQRRILEKLKDKITELDISRILSGNRQLQFLNDINLLLICQAFYDIAITDEEKNDFSKINPNDFFTENELNEALHVLVKETINKDSITFHNVYRDNHKKFGYIYHIPAASAQQIVDMANNNITNYNYEAQREYLKKELFGEEIKIPKIFPEKQDAVAEAILNNNYYPVDTIVINVFKNGEDKLYFKPTLTENIGDLTLYKVEGSTNDIIDGANREQGIIKADMIAKEENKTIDTHFKIDVINVPLKNSNDCITQINKQTPINEDRIKILDTSKYTLIAKDINMYESEETNILYQKLAESIKEFNQFNKISTIQVFAEGLEDHFKDILDQNNPVMNRKVLRYEIDFFNEWFGSIFNVIKNIPKTKKETVIFDINMFYCYIYVSRQLFDLYKKDNSEWIKNIEKIISAFDWKKTNVDWINLKTTGKLTSKTKESIIKYFKKKINDAIYVTTE